MKKLISIQNPKFPISEAYKAIRTNIEFSILDKNVLILDGDLRNPSVHRMFGISNIKGLTDILVSGKDFLECVHATEVTNLHVLTYGPIPPNPSEMLSSKKMKDFVK
ncbi:tyrosine-protein kinase family protein [Romboutsia sp.]|uniref:tyrosine-protein kinase family protein n=1 Tax=Romboutsia sp. TaxID=1965302 RepID=UPI003F3D62FF